MESQRLAILGHELQHAAEIAEAAGVVDRESMASLYSKIGFRSADGRLNAFDSRRAIETGQQVGREAQAAFGAAGSR